MKLRFILYLLITFTFSSKLYSNTTWDSLNRKTDIAFKSFADSAYLDTNQNIIVLADTFFKAVTQKKRDYILDNTPTWDAYYNFLDSATKAKYSETTFRYKFLYFKTGLKKQFKRLLKDYKKQEINLRSFEPQYFSLEHGLHPDYEREFCYINLYMQKRDKQFVKISILILKMDDQWFFADDLSFSILKKDKKN